MVQLANSKQWLRALYYLPEGAGYKSLVKGDLFFLSEKGQSDPLAELKATISAFKNNQDHKLGLKVVCLLPARFLILKQAFPHLFNKSIDCNDYLEWLKGLDPGQLYLVFSSAYPNNPASMFGHTFLRFDRANRGESESSKELLGYSLAFQARTDTNDNPLQYTWKGITGGYAAYLEIKPHYVNIGVYNNSESRDLWEYPIDLTPDQKQLLLAHVWELANLVAFDYFFFDENCSTFLLRTLEVVKLDWDLPSKNNLFVVPQQTLKEIVAQSNHSVSARQRQSIRKQLQIRYQKLNPNQKKLYRKARKGEIDPSQLQDTEVLDGLIDLWKYQNYKDYLKITEDQKKRMHSALVKRASLGGSSEQLNLPIQSEQRPDKGHDFSNIGFDLSTQQSQIDYSYGIHQFHDRPLGMDPHSYIEFMHLSATYQQRLELTRLKVADILSVPDFSWHLPAFSWRGSLTMNGRQQNQWNLLAGMGMAQSQAANWQFFALAVTNLRPSQNHRPSVILPGINLGFRKEFATNTWSSAEIVLLDKDQAVGQIHWNYNSGKWVTTPYMEFSQGKTEFRLKFSRYF